MKKLSILSAAALGFSGLVVAPAVHAGEITGNGTDFIVNGESYCAYSGQNDTPNGQIIMIGGNPVQIDPGGHVQSYGYFKSQKDFIGSPSDPANRAVRGFPGVGCNPNLGGSPHEDGD